MQVLFVAIGLLFAGQGPGAGLAAGMGAGAGEPLGQAPQETDPLQPSVSCVPHAAPEPHLVLGTHSHECSELQT